ncbi:hypothetical protein [Larkinella arboricola]
MFIKLTVGGQEKMINLNQVKAILPEDGDTLARIVYQDGEIDFVDETYSRIEFLLATKSLVIY